MQVFKDTFERICTDLGMSMSDLYLMPLLPEDNQTGLNSIILTFGKIFRVDEKNCKNIHGDQVALEAALTHELCHIFFGDDRVLSFLDTLLRRASHNKTFSPSALAEMRGYYKALTRLCEERADLFGALKSPAHAKGAFFSFRRCASMTYKGKSLDAFTGGIYPKLSERQDSMLKLFQELSII